MKILVLGCNSMIGHVIALYLKNNGHMVVGYDNKYSNVCQCIIGDVYNIDQIENTILSNRFDSVINCTAVINQNAEEDKAAASFINIFIPLFLEKITKKTDVIVVHRSTDCIFSGLRGQYRLSDIPDGDTFYARSKALGEIVNDKDITIRTSLIGPELDKSGSSLFNWFYNQSGCVNGFDNAIWTGLTTIEYAREIETLLNKKAHGIFQLVPDYSISKYELLCLFEKYFPNNRYIKHIDCKRIDRSLVQELGIINIKIPDYESMIMEMANWINQHKEMYKNYYI